MRTAKLEKIVDIPLIEKHLLNPEYTEFCAIKTMRFMISQILLDHRISGEKVKFFERTTGERDCSEKYVFDNIDRLVDLINAKLHRRFLQIRPNGRKKVWCSWLSGGSIGIVIYE